MWLEIIEIKLLLITDLTESLHNTAYDLFKNMTKTKKKKNAEES